ncbi:MAG: glycosyltransferase family 4 protein [Bacteroidia bacterium]|nr:glycosyltransferase family 4 protein [Bacteroidia bacterium]
MNRKRIVIAHLYNNFTGSPKVLADVVNALSSAGIEVDLFTNKGPGFLDGLRGINRFHAWYKWHPNKYIRLIHFSLSQVFLFFSLLRYWRKDVCIYANTILPFGAGLAGWLMGKKVIYHVHETEFQPPLFTKLLLTVIRLSANKLIFVSKYLQEYHDFPHIPQEVVYNALPREFMEMIKEYAPQEKQQGSTDTFEVLMMCSLKKAKGIFEYIELAKKLPEIHFTLIISQKKQQILQFLGETSIPQNLSLEEVKENVHPYYAKTDLLLSLSHPIEWPETFGMTLLEGMSYGIPSIVPPVGAPLEIIREGQDGFHLDMRELEKIEAKIQELKHSPEIMQSLSQMASQRAKDFSIEVFQEQILRAIA